MNMASNKNREFFNLCLIVLITIVFSLFSLSIDFIGKVQEYFPLYTTSPINDFLIHVIFLWLLVTLGITYQRWRRAISERMELEEVISSINTDVLVVVDNSGIDRKVLGIICRRDIIGLREVLAWLKREQLEI